MWKKIKYFWEDITFWYSHSIFVKGYWKLQHRFNSKHQYYKINDIGLTAGYYDPDIRITQAVFTLFCEWKDSVEETVDWGHRSTEWFYLCEAYDYWKVERPLLVAEGEAYWEGCSNYDFPLVGKRDTLEAINWKVQAGKGSTIDEVVIPTQDEYYLKIIISHLSLLWYP